MSEVWSDIGTLRFWRRFLTFSFAAVGAMAVLIEVFETLFPNALAIQGTRWALIILSLSCVYGTFMAWPHPIQQTYSMPNTVIRVLKGDLLKQGGHLVIGTCDTFDTLPPNIIARSSLQGQALDHLFGGDVAELDRQLGEALGAHSPLETVRKEGKQERYELGTVAVLKNGSRKLFFLAYTSMNEVNQARSTPDGVWKSLLSLWREISRHANGGVVSVPVIGGGQSRMAQVLPAQDSIRFIALSFMLASRTERICDELRIVVRAEDFHRLDRLEIQSFLSSLRPS
jgi:hypothetical protein